MCSIMGYCDRCADFSAFKKGFDQTISRGPDDSRIVDTGNGLLGFHRLAIMGLTPEGMQPFELNGSYAVCNGEIYGYEKELIKYTEVIGRKGTGGAPYLFAHCVASQPYERIYRI